MTEATKKKISKWFWILVISPFALLMFLVLLVWMFADIPSFAELENPDNKLATQIIAEDGEILTTFHIENRTYVSYDELSENLVHAAVATEDVRFYRHSGIDFIGLGRVLFKTILLSNSSQGGGSTITQQLAKTLYPRAEMEKKIPGIYHIKMVWTKLKEWITAVKLERDYTKDEIMTMYLNSIFFGSGAYGVRAASETFFGKHPSELTIEESAMLVGMVNKPTRYNPALNPDKALVRRNFVIGQMEKAGYFDDQAKAAGVKTTAFRDSIRQIPIELNYQVQDHNSGHAPYFRDMVRRVMSAKKPKRSSYSVPEDYTADSLAWATDDLYGWLEKNKKADGTPYDLDRDGLRIYTTINYKMQKYAEEAVQERMRDLQADFRKDLRHKTNKPFSNDIDAPTRDRLMQQARKWSDRYRVLKKKGLNDSQIFKTFSEPVNMRVFAYNKKGYIDTTMTPDDSIRYYKSILRTAFVAMEPGTGHVKAYVGGPDYRYFKYDNVRQGKRQVGSTIKPFLYTLAMQEGLTPCTKVTNVPVTFLTTCQCGPNLSKAALSSISRSSGWAMPMRSFALSCRDLPQRSTAPYSVTIQWASALGVTTPAPGFSIGTIFGLPLAVLDAKAVIETPPSDIVAPLTKSSWPPVPEKILVPIESAQIWPVRSTSTAELIAIMFGLREMTQGSLTYLMSFIRTSGLWSMKEYTSWEPRRKEATTFPVSIFLQAPLTTPFLIRPRMPSANISV